MTSGISAQENSYDYLQKGGRGLNIKDILMIFRENDFVTKTIEMAGQLNTISSMVDNKQPFMAGSTSGEEVSRLVFLCFGTMIEEAWRNSNLLEQEKSERAN